MTTQDEPAPAGHNAGPLVDDLGRLKAQIADLEAKAKGLHQQLEAMGAGSYEGALFQATVSDVTRESPDAILKAKIKQLLEKHTSRQFRKAHTKETSYVSIRVAARRVA